MNKKLLTKIAVSLFTMTSVFFSNSAITHAENVKSRIYGKDRIETSIQISKEGWKTGSETAIIAQGYNYADALCSAPLAKKYNAPIILTSQSGLSDNTINELKRLNVKNVYVIGGPKVVSENVDKQLQSININNIKRIYGATRYETSLKIAEQLGSVEEVFITSGNGYADSLSVASIAAKKGAPILFADKNELKESVKQYITKVDPKKVFVIGGEGVISNEALKEINNFERISGQDRFATNKSVLERFKSDINFQNVYVVKGAGPNGNEFADALSSSALAAQKSSPVVLTNKYITEDLKNFINDNITSLSNIISIGGEAVVPSSILDELKSSLEIIEITKENSVYGEDKIKDINTDIVVNADKVTLQNLNVKGVITVNPGEKGSLDIKNVTANTIVVKSGAENSIHIINSKSDNLIVESKSNVRVQLKDNSTISNTYVRSNSILDNTSGNFGNVVIENTSYATENKVVLKGKFDKAIEIDGKANINFNGEFAQITVKKEAKLNILNGSKVEKISANSKCNIKIEKEAIVYKVEKRSNDVNIDGTAREIISIDATVVLPSGNTFTLIISKDNGNIELKNQVLEIKENYTAMDYLKSVAKVTENQGAGFISGIDGLINKTSGELTDEQRQNGVFGIDWFIYLNSTKASVGADEIYPKSGDVLRFDYHEWDWSELAPGTDEMPIKLQMPSSVNMGEKFNVKVTCVSKPVYNAVVKVDGKEVGNTDENGCLSITLYSSGTHTITVEKDGATAEKSVEVIGGLIIPTYDTVLVNIENPISFNIIKKADGTINISGNSNNQADYITLTLYDSSENLVYINQSLNGKMNLSTKLSAGKYHGFVKASSSNLITISEFEVK